MSFDLPRDVILPVDEIDVRLDPAPHPFERQNLPAIEQNWRHETAINPHIFDGAVALLSELSYREGRLAGRCHIVRYATFMYWRRHRAAENAGHAFAHAMLVSSDGALVAIRMGPHTVNAGRVYFAAGSFELEDFRDGRVDVAYNMRREVGEEIGIDLAEADTEPGRRHYLLSTQSGTVIFRRYRARLTANELVNRINAFLAGEEQPEIAGPVVIHSASDLPDNLAPHMKPLVEWHFSHRAG
jgi:8-oxo-dGTP pyrophosphatase MutT (NUDIX family)